jgi:hypothetical protein
VRVQDEVLVVSAHAKCSAERVLLASDSYCPRCGHNRDASCVSSIDNEDGTRSCQMCSAEPDDVWLIGSSLDWLENAEHGQNKDRCRIIADILRDLWRMRSPAEQMLPANVENTSGAPVEGSPTPAPAAGPRNESALADAIEFTLSGTQFEPMLNDAEWRTIISALRKVAPTTAAGPRSSIPPALSAWLEEIREYLSSRQDVNDGSDGPRPNEEMTLLANLDEAMRRPIFPNGNTAGPSAVEEFNAAWNAEVRDALAVRALHLRHAEELDRLRADIDSYLAQNAELASQNARLRSEIDGQQSELRHLREGRHLLLKDVARERERAERAEAALRGGMAQSSFWVVEQFKDGKSCGYWDGASSRSFTRDINRAVQFCRKDDAYWATRGWHWGDTQITEHLMIGGEERIYTKADMEAACELAVAARLRGGVVVPEWETIASAKEEQRNG